MQVVGAGVEVGAGVRVGAGGVIVSVKTGVSVGRIEQRDRRRDQVALDGGMGSRRESCSPTTTGAAPAVPGATCIVQPGDAPACPVDLLDLTAEFDILRALERLQRVDLVQPPPAKFLTDQRCCARFR